MIQNFKDPFFLQTFKNDLWHRGDDIDANIFGKESVLGILDHPVYDILTILCVEFFAKLRISVTTVVFMHRGSC